LFATERYTRDLEAAYFRMRAQATRDGRPVGFAVEPRQSSDSG
jgi:hypothetical protein